MIKYTSNILLGVFFFEGLVKRTQATKTLELFQDHTASQRKSY